MHYRVIRAALLLITISFTSCHTYKEYNKDAFGNYTWGSAQEIVFKPVIEDVTKTYTLSVGIRHMYGLQFETMSVTVKIIAPSGKEEKQVHDFKLMKGPDQYVGSCAGDLCDLETVVNNNLKFTESGEHQLIVTHNFSGNKIPGIMEVGVIIDEK
jgi:gliding motility-associated lipoprotein GldH